MPSIKQRVSLLRAHKGICPYDNQLIESLADLAIDHIIPKSLAADQLAHLLKRLNKEDLNINSYFNWFPTHQICNSRKGDTVHSDAALHHYLQIAKEKEPLVREEEARFDRQARASGLLATVARQIELGFLSKEAAVAFLEGAATPPSSNADPTILGFSINLAEATATDPQYNSPGETLMTIGDEETEVPSFSPESLQMQLENALQVLNSLIVTSETVQNNGETLSIRYAVWLLDLDLLPARFPNAWQLLEVAPFSEVYPGQDASTLVHRAVILKRNELIVDSGSNDPLPYRYCPICASQDLHRTSNATREEEIYYINCGNCGWGEKF
jgi:hypothetical protein